MTPVHSSQVEVKKSESSLDEVDYGLMQLKVGIEVHQQLSTEEKLFCNCSAHFGSLSETTTKELRDLYPVQFIRKLRPVASELGEIDVAARFESRGEILVRYYANPSTSCLVEADEEPPHPINQEALNTCILFGLALKSRIVDEIHVMRKIVVDGSNTSGFQRTALVAIGGRLLFGSEKASVQVQSICLEEDAARALTVSDGSRSFALDRLGTPLVEVALAPIVEANPERVRAAAFSLGRLMRSTGRLARGLGTIRQDLNVSILNGAVVEVKGVQQLDLVSKVVRYEALRQRFFEELASEIKKTVGDRIETKTKAVTKILSNTRSKVVKSILANTSAQNMVLCILIRNFAGFIGKENALGSRLGKELGSIAKVYGLGGVFHSDELPNYGITQAELDQIRREIGAETRDAFVLVAGPLEKVEACSVALIQRINFTPRGVPPETRAATEDGETRFLRPRPGSARMYPETDIPLEIITTKRLDNLRKHIPPPWEVQVENFQKKYDLPEQLAEQMLDSDQRGLFEEVVEKCKNLPPRLVASILLDTLQMLARDGVDVARVDSGPILGMFQLLNQGRFAKEAVPMVIKMLAQNPRMAPEEAVNKLGVSAITLEELNEIVAKEILANMELIRSKGASSLAILMGKVMQRVRGRIDGKIVSETVETNLDKTMREIGRI